MATHIINISTSNDSFMIEDSDYLLELTELSSEVVNKTPSQTLIEMIAVTGATHHGTVRLKQGQKGNKELNSHMEFSPNGIPCFIVPKNRRKRVSE